MAFSIVALTLDVNPNLQFSESITIKIAPIYNNKAGYTATEVACGWEGAIFEVTRPFGRSSEVKEIKS